VRRPKVTKLGAADAGLKLAIGLLSALFFLVVVVGGGVYRTECISNTGQISKTWSPEGDIPYLWSPDDTHCQAHTLTRFVMGKIGIMGDVDR